MEIKNIDVSEGTFMANGRKYTIMKSISIDRFKKHEEFSIYLAFGISFNELYGSLNSAFDMLNKGLPANAAVTVHNIMNGIKEAKNEKRIHKALLIAGLFLIREDEDPRYYDEAIAIEKIEDWQEEGYSMNDFFDIALSSIVGFREQYKNVIQKQLTEIQKEIDR